MDDLEKICDKLENCSKKENCNKNEIVCTKAILQSYIEGDDNKRLKLKALMKQHEKDIFETVKETISIVSTIAAFGVSCVSLFVSVIIDDVANAEQIIIIVAYVCFLLSIIIGVCKIGKYEINRNHNINKWKKYIQVVLEDMECKTENLR